MGRWVGEGGCRTHMSFFPGSVLARGMSMTRPFKHDCRQPSSVYLHSFVNEEGGAGGGQQWW